MVTFKSRTSALVIVLIPRALPSGAQYIRLCSSEPAGTGALMSSTAASAPGKGLFGTLEPLPVQSEVMYGYMEQGQTRILFQSFSILTKENCFVKCSESGSSTLKAMICVYIYDCFSESLDLFLEIQLNRNP